MNEPNDPHEPERARLRGEISRTKRSFFLIFGVGAVCVALVILYVMRHLPEGQLQSGYGKPAPLNEPGRNTNPSSSWCKKFGDSCEFSPGKLGSCMERENCTGPHCLFCQSQH